MSVLVLSVVFVVNLQIKTDKIVVAARPTTTDMISPPIGTGFCIWASRGTRDGFGAMVNRDETVWLRSSGNP